MAQTERPQATI